MASLVVVVSAVFGSIGQTDRQTHTQTDADECFTTATLVSMHKYLKTCLFTEAIYCNKCLAVYCHIFNFMLHFLVIETLYIF